MKTKFIFHSFFLLSCFLLIVSCQEDDAKIGELTAPSNLQVEAQLVGKDDSNPNGDGSGVVNFQASANHAISYKFVHPNGSEIVAPNGSASLTFTNLGVNVYNVTVVAYGAGGISTTTTISVEVLANYTPPQDLLDKLVGDGSRTWRIKAEKPGHFGLGPVGGTIPVEWYGAGPNEKEGVGMYDDRYIFNSDGTFNHITNNTNDEPDEDNSGTVFGRNGLIDEIGSGGTVDGGDVLNMPYNDYSSTWFLTAPGGIETIHLSGTSFIGYYTGGNHQYSIVDRSIANEMLLKTTDGNNEFDWWFVITSDDVVQSEIPEYNNLVWSDEFDGTELNAENWSAEIGTGTNGWGNQELQYYTDREDNLQVSDGTLKITAKREDYEGSQFTSARIKTEDKFEFTYGRVEIRAKLAGGGGTWPALWMLGEDYATNAWPACGEIDIMEYQGNIPDQTIAAMHWTGNSGGNGPAATTAVANAETEFHIYECIWSPEVVKFFVDGTEFHSVENNLGLPFNDDFFLIFNVAMGGTLGGEIDDSFVSSTMEVDYVKVYQE